MSAAERIVVHCTRCDHAADFASRNGRWHVSSFDPLCDRGRECLSAWAERLGCARYQLLEDPRPFLTDVADARAQHDGRRPAPLPTKDAIRSWHESLLANKKPLAYALSRLSRASLHTSRLGWDGERLTLPVRDPHGELVNVRKRALGPGEPFVGLAGRGSHLYPDVPRRGPVLLVAGEFDAWVAREVGLPGVTTTCGACLPEHLAASFVRRRVAVAYDAGEEDAAERTVARLNASGTEAWVVRLGLLGLPHGGDLSDFFHDGGKLRALVDLIRQEERA